VRYLLFLLILITSIPSQAQQPDSLHYAIDSQAKSFQQQYKEIEDSLYRLRMKQKMEQYGQSLDEFLAEKREEKRKEDRRMYIRIGVLTVFLFALVFALVRKRKQLDNSN
jgi:predicted Holliday junction resolvase-like endonuclease